MSDELEVRGGAGGTAAQLEDLDAAATSLRRSAAALLDAAGALRVGRSLLDGLQAAPDGLGAALALDAGVLEAHGELLVAEEGTRRLGDGVAAAVEVYRTAEEHNRELWFVSTFALPGGPGALAGAGLLLDGALVRGGPASSAVAQVLLAGNGDEQAAPEPLGPPVPPVACAPGELAGALPAAGDPQRAAVPVSALREPLTETPSPADPCQRASRAPSGAGEPSARVRLADGSPQLAAALVGTAVAGGVVLGARSASPEAARRLVGRWSAGGFADSTRSAVAPVPVPAAVAAQGPPRGVADLISRTVQTSDTTTGPAGRVRVERVRGAGGRTAAVVYLPGVQDWYLDSRNPLSAASAVRAEGGVGSAYSDLVVQALEQAHVAPGEPVMLVGHSLGGIVAAQVAGDPAVRERFDVTAVVTAGSPVGAADVPRDVSVLSLEHPDDVVPGIDGTAGPDAPNTTTVTGETPAGLGAHDSQGYAALGARVDASDHASLVAWREAAAPFLAAPGAVSEVTETRGTTVDPDPHPVVLAGVLVGGTP